MYFSFQAITTGVLPAQTSQWDWTALVKFELERGGLSVNLGPIVTILLVLTGVFAATRLYIRWRALTTTWEPVKGTLKVANLGEVEIRPTHETVKIAYQAWVEISTRKTGLKFNEEHDVIVDVYNSWYELFKNLRDLARDIPAHRLRQSKDTRELVRIMVTVLNAGLRPHLTEWQAKFRRWYDQELEDPANKAKTPQEIQKNYPHYQALVEHLKECNTEFVEYANWLREIAEGVRK